MNKLIETDGVGRVSVATELFSDGQDKIPLSL